MDCRVFSVVESSGVSRKMSLSRECTRNYSVNASDGCTPDTGYAPATFLSAHKIIEYTIMYN